MTNFLPSILSARARLIHEGFKPRFVYLPIGGHKLLEAEIRQTFESFCVQPPAADRSLGNYIAGMPVIERPEMDEGEYAVMCDPAPGH